MSRATHRAAVCIALVAAIAPATRAQPENNECIDALAISGLASFSFDTVGASSDGVDNDACCSFSSCAIYNDVWFCWTATASGPVAAQTCSLTTLDSRMAVFDGCSCPEGGGILTCNDDSCDLQSRIEWNAVAGHSYLIRLGSFGALQFGSGQFEIVENNIPILAGPFTRPGSDSTYYMLNSSSWTAAEGAAVVMGGHLATVDDAEENEFLRASVLGFDGADRRGWIGLNDIGNEGVYTWTSGAPLGFTNWNGGEPNNTNGLEHFIEMFGSTGAWNDNTDFPPFFVFGLVELAGEDPCPGDLDGDGSVNLQDLATLLAHFGMTSGATPEDGDLDADTDVDLQDLATLLAAFGTNCP